MELNKGVDLTSLISELRKAGIKSKDVSRLLPSLLSNAKRGGGFGTIAAAVAAGLAPDAIKALIGQEPPMQAQQTKYMYTPDADLAYTRTYYSPLNTLRRGLGLLEMDSPKQRRESFIESLNQQAEQAEARRRGTILIERQAEADMQAQRLEAALREQALVQEGLLGQQNIRSLGELQKQRTQSAFEAAQSLLNTAIQDIAYREKLGQAESNQQLASIPNV